MAHATSGIGAAPSGLAQALSFHQSPPEPSHADDEFWAAFELDDDYVPRVPWYRKTARWLAALFVVAMVATGALIPWGEFIDQLDNVSEPDEILAIADEVVAESPYGWLVTDVQVRDIFDTHIGGFVQSNPPDGIVTIDLQSWDPDDLRSTVAHEIGHLLDFAAYGNSIERRDGLASEAWAECAAVDAGFRSTDGDTGDTEYHCTDDELAQYLFSVSLLGEVCKSWGDGACRVVTPIGGSG